MAEQATVMVLKVDLQCPCCYKKVKKILCRFPQIRDQVYDENANTVTITVVCCNPDKIRDKLCCRGDMVIKSIQIKDPPEKPEEPKIVVIEKPKEPEKPEVVVIEKPKEPEKPDVVVLEKPNEPENPKEVEKPQENPLEEPEEAPSPKPEPPKKPEPAPNPPTTEPLSGPEPIHVNGFPPAFPVSTCCGQCYEGYGDGPCYHVYGTLPPPQPCSDDFGYGYGRGCHVSRCDNYFSDENPRGCSIM